MLPPIESIDYMFIRSFCEEDEAFDADLPLMLQDFFIHEGEAILEYSSYVYADDSFENSGALRGIRYKFLNLLLAGARHGGEYAAEMLCRIYKIYYRREYNQLKRFKTLSLSELESFDSEGELFAITAARILTIAPFMGIDVDPECRFVQDDIDEILEDKAYGYKHVPDFLEFKEGVFDKASEDAQELLDRLKKADRDYYFNNPIQKFMFGVLRYLGVPSDFDLLCEPFFEADRREYSITFAILRSIWPKKAFSDQELEFYHGLYRILNIFIDHLVLLDEDIDMMLGRYDKFSHELERSLYRPAKKNPVKVARSVAGGKLSEPVKPGAVTTKPLASDLQGASTVEKEKDEESERLRSIIRAKDQTIGQLNRLYREASEREKQNRIDQESWSTDREELVKLREYLYHLTEEDLDKTEVSQKMMEQEISGKRIAIVGGHDNWAGYLRERFPQWVFVKPGISNTLPEQAVLNTEYVFFFTDTLSHGTYNKFVKTVRNHKIPFGYLHGTNIPMTVRQIYEAVKNR